MDGLALIKHLLPRARAWRITIDKQLRQFFRGLADLPETVKAFFDAVFTDIDPQLTRELTAWEAQFALPNTGLTTQARRDRLDAAWQALGGQSPRYIQDTLQGAGFDVFVHEWWVPSVEHPLGGAVDGDVVPVVRVPSVYLWDGVSDRQFVGCGHDDAYCGGDDMFSNSQLDPPGYALVNKVTASPLIVIGCGHDSMECGGDDAATGLFSIAFALVPYELPTDPDTYPFFLYIGGETFPDTATVQANRQDEFEDLCLKICPTEQWLGILVNYA